MSDADYTWDSLRLPAKRSCHNCYYRVRQNVYFIERPCFKCWENKIKYGISNNINPLSLNPAKVPRTSWKPIADE